MWHDTRIAITSDVRKRSPLKAAALNCLSHRGYAGSAGIDEVHLSGSGSPHLSAHGVFFKKGPLTCACTDVQDLAGVQE